MGEASGSVLSLLAHVEGEVDVQAERIVREHGPEALAAALHLHALLREQGKLAAQVRKWRGILTPGPARGRLARVVLAVLSEFMRPMSPVEVKEVLESRGELHVRGESDPVHLVSSCLHHQWVEAGRVEKVGGKYVIVPGWKPGPRRSA